MKPKFYTGIGSRKTPGDILSLMTDIARAMDSEGYTLRSGHADGADKAFERGSSHTELFLPWPNFNGHLECPRNGSLAILDSPSEDATELASKFHPGWKYLSHGAKKLHARNCHQVLGHDLKTFSDVVICWTPDGAETQVTSKTGGTGQALRIAIDRRIPICNLAIPEVEEMARVWLYDK